MRETGHQDGLEAIYELRTDVGRIQTMKALSNDSSRATLGLSPKPYLIGSRKFWKFLGTNRLPQDVAEGRITRVFWASMGDYPMFEVTTPDGSVHEFHREGDIARYVGGLRARIETVDMPWKPGVSHLDSTASPIITGIFIEPSTARSDPRAPGPYGLMLLQEHERSQTAWGLRCIEHWLEIQGIGHPELDALTEHLWDWLAVDQDAFLDWHDHPPLLVGDPSAPLGLDLDEEVEVKFRQAIIDATDLAYFSLFGAFDHERHIEFAAALGSLLEPFGVNLPGPSEFGLPEGLELTHQWGPMPADLVAQWRRHPIAWPNYSTIEIATDRYAGDGASLGATAAIVEVYDGAYEIELVGSDGKTEFLGPMEHAEVRFVTAPSWRMKRQ